ncbi:hypothetical protein PG994_002932 [Apiospora phragmitis]|uniref:Uncharacterized protein n=1 Tax=Apiospora phragmitis TaxID=2905665 RepID=A0ABR1W6L0_9PEZI
MMLTLIIVIFLSNSSLSAAMAMSTTDRIRSRAITAVGEIVELCPNPDFQGIDETIPCLNYTDPTTPKRYGQRDTCSKL